ncbi:hypothetical protein OC846_005092 [Tilletia horrida]|uniref:Actin-like ATPase domain-containing protein n=1 Tax=Tilletia horrida TaxID=155126 RepID=A0AAN6JS49_9BASI|nr:hypothetical protein OC846_005092 [Tilletia horrida]
MSREAKCAIIVHGGYTIRAGIGLHELFQRPTAELRARVGLSRAWLRQRRKDAPSLSKEPLPPPQSTDYLVGRALDDALTANPADIIIYYPLRGSHVTDWQQLIALWRHLLFDLLRIKRSRNDSHTLLALPAPIHRETYTTVAQIFFELFNAPALSIVETPLISAYAAGALTAVTVDLGWDGCSITPLVDGNIIHQAIVRTRVGTRLCTVWLAHLLSQDASVVQELGQIADAAAKSGLASSTSDEARVQTLLVELAQHLLEEGLVRMKDERDATGAQAETATDDDGNLDIAAALVQGRERALVEENERKKAAEAEGAAEGGEEGATKTLTAKGEDGANATVDFYGRRITVGAARFRFAEPLLSDPTLLHAVKLPQLSRRSVALHEPSTEEHDEDGLDGFGAGMHEGEQIPSILLDNVTVADDEDEPFSLHANGSSTKPPTFSSALNIAEAISLAISRTATVTMGNSFIDSSVPLHASVRKQALWENLVITGAPTRIRGLTAAITAACGLHVGVASQGQGGGGAAALSMGAEEGGGGDFAGLGAAGLQPRNVRALKVPDYFAEFKERTDLAPFLGATIYTKVTLGNPTGSTFISKESYNDRGPSAFFSVLPAS